MRRAVAMCALLAACGGDGGDGSADPSPADVGPVVAPDAWRPPAELGPPVENPWIVFPAGCFTMGADALPGARPPHEVCLEAFELSRAEVTVREYADCLLAGACDAPHFTDGTCWVTAGRPEAVYESLQALELPVVCVDWFQAVAYAEFAGARLPSEAEWEYAAQGGGAGTVFPWGDENPDCDRAVMTGPEGPCEPGHLAPPCSREAGNSPQGACDLAGNAWEWVDDVWAEDTPDRRVVRGGGWPTKDRDYFKARYRDDEPAEIRYEFTGFRLAR